MKKKKVLFVCTHNSSRSQMAEGLLDYLYPDEYSAFSAGTHPSGVNKFAVQVMKDAGIDISSHSSKTVDTFLNESFDYVITVCDSAKETCPYFPNSKKIMHKGFEDPSLKKGSDEEILFTFRKVRDQIKDFLIKEFYDDNK